MDISYTAFCLFIITDIWSALAQDISNTLVTQQCQADSSLCYNLYGEASLLTWEEAFSRCVEMEQTLATVLDNGAQTLIGRFTESPGVEGAVAHAWMAGKRDNDATWRDMEGNQFQGAEVVVQTNNMGSCVTVGATDKFLYSRPCQQQPGYPNMIACQLKAADEDNCRRYYGYHISGVCYRIIHQEASSPIWTQTAANQFCLNSYPEGSLAFSDVADSSFLDLVQFVADQYRYTGEVWIGIQKYQWTWVTENGQEQMTYTNWNLHEGSSVVERCLHIDLRDNSSWADKGCHMLNQYFVCQQGMTSTITPTITTTTTAPTTTTTTTPTTTSTTTTPTPTTTTTTTTSTTTTSTTTTSPTSTTSRTTTTNTPSTASVPPRTHSTFANSSSSASTTTTTASPISTTPNAVLPASSTTAGETSSAAPETSSSNLDSVTGTQTSVTYNGSTSPNGSTEFTSPATNIKATSVQTKGSFVLNEKAFISSIITVSVLLTAVVIVAHVWDHKNHKRKKKPEAEDIYFGADDATSPTAGFSAAFNVENGVDKWGTGHFGRNINANTQAVDSDSVHTADMSVNPAYESSNESNPDTSSHGGVRNSSKPEAYITQSSDVIIGSSPRSTMNDNLIPSSKYSDVSYGRKLQFDGPIKSSSVYDEIDDSISD